MNLEKIGRWAAFSAGMGIATATLAVAQTADSDLAPIPLKLPKAAFIGTPADAASGKIESAPPRPRAMPLAPKGTINLALHKKVTSSAPPFSGSLDLITDGNKEVSEDSAVELKPRLQWVQIDLGATSPIYDILIWHFHGQPIAFHDVIVQVSDDKNFIDGVTTLFNNDAENATGMGIGKDREYVETYEGKLIEAHGVRARFVRLYSKGSTFSNDKLNRYTEVEVYGLPPK